jgi:hypothetical protein
MTGNLTAACIPMASMKRGGDKMANGEMANI